LGVALATAIESLSALSQAEEIASDVARLQLNDLLFVRIVGVREYEVRLDSAGSGARTSSIQPWPHRLEYNDASSMTAEH
jgi:hypothetical protein